MTSAIASAQFISTASSRERTCGSLVRSDSKTIRNARPLAGDELEVGGDGPVDPRLVVGPARLEGRPHERLERVAVLVQQRQVEIELAREVLVQNRFGDTGAVGDLVHGRGVIAGLDEDGLGGIQQLGAPLTARHPLSAGGVGAGHARPGSGVT